MRKWWRRFFDHQTLRDEIDFHLEMRAQRNREAGMSPEEARASAQRQFGNRTLIGEDVRGVHIYTFIESLGQDLRYAARSFLRNPMFTATSVFAVMLGIGASTAVFSVVDRILFRSLPYPHGDRLVSLGMMAPLDTNEFLFAEPYFDWRKHQTPFESITSFTAGTDECDLTETNPVRLTCSQVEANFIQTLGISPLLGRNFTFEEDRPKAPRVALLTFGVWQSRFGRDPKIAGKIITLDGQPVTVVGVLPPNFEMPNLGSPDVLLPEALNEVTERDGRGLRLFARLKPGVSVTQALAEMQPLFNRALTTVPDAFRKEVHFRIRSLRDRQIQDARVASWVLLGAVAFVLLIACANIANLLLARSMERRRELAIRSALGAGRGRLIRQTLTESSLLGIAGGVAGCGLAWILLRILVGIAPAGIPRLEQATLDGRVLLFAVGISLLSGLIFGLAPAFENPRSEMLAGSRSTGGPRMLLRESLVAAQIAVSMILLTGAGLLLHSLWKIDSVPLGMSAEHVVTAEFVLGRQRYSDPARQLAFYDALEAGLQQIPGVTASTISDSLPLYGGSAGRPFAVLQVEGQPPFEKGTGGMVTWRYVTPGYFAALGIPIVLGRTFREEDRAPAQISIILSESLAQRLFPQGNAIGHRIRVDEWATVIGVAKEVRNLGPLREAGPEYYLVRKPVPDAIFRIQMPPSGWRRSKVAIRTVTNEKLAADWLQKTFTELDPALPVSIGTMRGRAVKITERPRFNAILLVSFAAMGVLLAAIGLYGVMAFLVGQRTAEIGVRMALGATPGAITTLVLSRAARWTLAGAAAGLIGSIFATRAIATLLFQVPSYDPWTFGVALPLLLLIAMTAAWIPSARAARIDPIAALRRE